MGLKAGARRCKRLEHIFAAWRCRRHAACLLAVPFPMPFARRIASNACLCVKCMCPSHCHSAALVPDPLCSWVEEAQLWMANNMEQDAEIEKLRKAMADSLAEAERQ